MLFRYLIVVCLIIFINSSIHVKKSTLISKNNNLNEIAVNNTTENNGLNDNSSNNNVLNNNISQNTVTQEPVQSSPKSTTINMAITGDIMCHNTIYNDALNKSTNEYDFSYIFEDIKYHIQTADIAVGNLETTFAGPDKGYSSYPTFNTPENLAYTLKKV